MNSGRFKSASMRRSRLSAALSVRNARASSVVGKTPMVSRKERRMNSASLARSDGGMFNSRSFVKTCSSMKFRGLSTAKAAGSSLLGCGTVTVVTLSRLRYQALTVASPLPVVLMKPASSTVATLALVALYLHQRVTSSLCPSLNFAVTLSCRLLPACVTRCGCATLSDTMRGSSAFGPGAPAAIQSAMALYSTEFTSKRLSPLCGTVLTAFSRNKLRAGSSSVRRRPFALRVIEVQSPSSSKPRSERRKPPCPAAAPWQAPIAQP